MLTCLGYKSVPADTKASHSHRLHPKAHENTQVRKPAINENNQTKVEKTTHKQEANPF
jgi:hypothetical protein